MKIVKPIGYISAFLVIFACFSPSPAADEARRAYDKMVEEATREADAYLQEKEDRQQAAEAASRENENVALKEKAGAERERILTEMDAVQQRGLGPNFTQGMKESQLEKLQHRLDRLTSDPAEYFKEQ